MKKIMVALMMIAISFNIQGISATQEEIDNAIHTALGYLGFTEGSELSEAIINDAVEAKKNEIMNNINLDSSMDEHKAKSHFDDHEYKPDGIGYAQIDGIGYALKSILFSLRDSIDEVSLIFLIDEAQYHLDPKYLQLYNTPGMSKNSLSDAERFAEEQFLKNMKELERYDVSERQKEIDAAREANL